MSRKSIILVGGPDSGKSNYVGRLWLSLKEHKGTLKRAGMPSSTEYVDAICAHLFKGEFAGRTDRNSERKDFSVPLRIGEHSEATELVVPDFTGELWRDAVMTSELPREWSQELENAAGALLFVRVHSPLNIQPLDWVTARDTLRHVGNGNEELEPPTQVILCELLRLLQMRLSVRHDGGKPRVAVVVTAWDLLDAERQAAGPLAYLSREFPLFAGALDDLERIEAEIYGVTIVGGDLQRDPEFQATYQSVKVSDRGWVIRERDGVWGQDSDVTFPVAWAMGE